MDLSLADRNLLLLDQIADIFHLKRSGTDWDTVRRSLSEDQVKAIYQVVAELWPPDTDIDRILPRPTTNLRALFLGDVRPESLVKHVSRFALYIDEILIVNPFLNPHVIAPQYNPLLAPRQYKLDTLQLVLATVLLEPWIRAGLVTFIPNPSDFIPGFGRKTTGLAEERLAKLGIRGPKDMSKFKEFLQKDEAELKADFKDWFFMGPEDTVETIVKNDMAPGDPAAAERMLKYIARQKQTNPFVLDQPYSEIGEQLTFKRAGGNLETGLYLSMLTGAFPCTDRAMKWLELQSIYDALSPKAKVWTPLTQAFSDLRFQFLNNVDSTFAASMRRDGRLESLRAFLRRIWSTAESAEARFSEEQARSFRDELTDEYRKAEAEWSRIDSDLANQSGLAGVAAAGAAIVSGGLQPLFAAGAGFCLGSIFHLLNASRRRKEFRFSNPMSVFIDLSNRSAEGGTKPPTRFRVRK